MNTYINEHINTIIHKHIHKQINRLTKMNRYRFINMRCIRICDHCLQPVEHPQAREVLYRKGPLDPQEL